MKSKATELFRKNLSELITSSGLTQKEFAKKLAISPAHLSNLLKKPGSVNLRTVEQVAARLDISLWKLFVDKSDDVDLERARKLVIDDLKKRFVADGYGWPPDPVKLLAGVAAFLQKK